MRVAHDWRDLHRALKRLRCESPWAWVILAPAAYPLMVVGVFGYFVACVVIYPAVVVFIQAFAPEPRGLAFWLLVGWVTLVYVTYLGVLGRMLVERLRGRRPSGSLLATLVLQAAGLPLGALLLLTTEF